ncbi:MAG: 4Fe-4S dicluster domain-containing protein [Deltaproteobacteria bacterium]|nr:4Fe-4S dicluster domain-containing protein [Deltaproteobacteria bacterium]
MKRLVFVFDNTKCFGCMGCIAACSNANSNSPESPWRSLHKLPPEDGRHDTVYLSLACNHCTDAPCVRACPTNAMSRQEDNGVVLHHADRCLGCRYCQMACPYDSIRYNESERVVSKCHFCSDRIAAGKDPACVATCFAGALTCQILENEDEASELEKEVPGFTHYSEARPSIRFKTHGEE